MNANELKRLADEQRVKQVGLATSLNELANAQHAFNLAVIATIHGSALDKFAEMGEANVDPTHPGVFLYPEKWTSVVSFYTPLLDGIITNEQDIPDAGKLTFIDLGVNKVVSTHITEFACDVRAVHYGEEYGPDAGITFNIARMYIRYKGGALYRYYPLNPTIWEAFVTITRQMMQGLKVSQTIGEYVEAEVKGAHDVRNAICEKLVEGKWVLTLNKQQRLAAKQEGNNARVMAEAEELAKSIRHGIAEYPKTEEEPAAHIVRMAEELKQSLPPEGQVEPNSESAPDETPVTPTANNVVEAPAEVTTPTLPATEGSKQQGETAPVEMPAPTTGNTDTSVIPTPQAQAENTSVGIGQNAEF